MAKATKLYEKSPSLKRDEDGNMAVHKPTEADGENMGTEGNPLPGSEGEMPVGPEHTQHAGERREMHHRHVHEKLALHHRHEMEHAAHKGDKAALHAKHEEEHKDMHDRHEKEMAQMHARHAKGKE